LTIAAAIFWPLLIVGALFLVINLLAVGGPYLAWKLHGKRSSPACIPFVGPIVLTMWVLDTHRPWWVIPLVWCCDLGTIICLVAAPGLFSQFWQTSAFTRILALHGTQGNQRATLTVHSTGRYHLEKYWKRLPGEQGIIRGGEVGNASETNGSYLLTPDRGGSRKLEPLPDGSFQIADEHLPDQTRHYSIAGWHFLRDR
jgi:hypothetical protein